MVCGTDFWCTLTSRASPGDLGRPGVDLRCKTRSLGSRLLLCNCPAVRGARAGRIWVHPGCTACGCLRTRGCHALSCALGAVMHSHGILRAAMRCHTPTCGFLVHSDPQFGGYCCMKCHWRWKHMSICKRKHGEYCEKVVAPHSALVAPNLAPDWYPAHTQLQLPHRRSPRCPSTPERRPHRRSPRRPSVPEHRSPRRPSAPRSLT